MTLQPSQMVSHYRLVTKIGEGGMGVVWKALDTRLNRYIALKLLPPELMADPERRQRFLREARAAAAVTHPNIATIHEIDEADDVVFIAMELVKGRTLRSLMTGRPMPIKAALKIAVEIAEGITEAHKTRVVHRDLKPENVMVTATGHVKVLDFGLAKLLNEYGEESATTLSKLTTVSGEMTREGKILGTPAYMSPEQARGQAVDTRSDVFSFGTMLYELVTGRLPFEGNTVTDILSAIIRDEPTPPSRLVPDMPAELDRIVAVCLQKDPQNRYLHTDQLASDLWKLKGVTDTGAQAIEDDGTTGLPKRSGRGLWIAGGAGAILLALAAAVWIGERPQVPQSGIEQSNEPSIAVLPFSDMSQDNDQEYFADGLSEELLNTLARIRGLHVAARTSSFSFKGKDIQIADIGRQLKVTTVLEGSVRKSGDHVRINAQLIKVDDGFHLWADAYDRELKDILAVQDDIARSVASALKVTLLREVASRQRMVNTEAYNLVLQAKHFRYRRGREDLDKAFNLLQQALTIDPNNAQAWSEVSGVYAMQAGSGDLGIQEGYEKARRAAEKALVLDDTLADAHVERGLIEMYYDWDWATADADFKQALALEPGNARAIRVASLLAGNLGRFEEAVILARKAADLDPISGQSYGNLGLRLLRAGRLEEAAVAFGKSLELNPQREGQHSRLGRVYLLQGKADAALVEMQKETADSWRLSGLALAYHSVGRQRESDAALNELINKHRDHSLFQIAEVYGWRGEAGKAFEWLDRAYSQRDGGLAEMKGDPLLKQLVTDPRWPAILKKMRLSD